MSLSQITSVPNWINVAEGTFPAPVPLGPRAPLGRFSFKVDLLTPPVCDAVVTARLARRAVPAANR
jgi:hypothetical protein